MFVHAGQYTCKEGKNSPCLVYVSFNHKIYVYWKVQLERMESTNLMRVLEQRPEFRHQLAALGFGEYMDKINKSINQRSGAYSPEVHLRKWPACVNAPFI